MHALIKYVIKIQVEGLYQKTNWANCDKLWVTDSKGNFKLSSIQGIIEYSRKDGFVAQMSAIKLKMAGIQKWLVY